MFSRAQDPSPVPTVAFRTLGCKLNQCETDQMEQALTARGCRVVPWGKTASVRIVNTCTVTAKADRQSRNEIHRAKRLDPSARLVVTGCYAQVAPDTVRAIPGVDLVLGNPDKAQIADHVDELLRHAGTDVDRETRSAVTPHGPGDSFTEDFITHTSGYSRAFLKIQNGCDSSCSYCVIPAARGPSRSMRLGDVLSQVRLLGARGYKEVVLTGIHLGAWGHDTQEGTLADLLLSLLEQEEVPRYRLSSIEPREVDDRLLEVMAAGKGRFADHFHIPLQSGSDRILQLMRRPYCLSEYAERAKAIRAAFPDAAIGTDIIAGFPGEAPEDFARTVELVDSLPLTYLHVFSYSDRPRTRAASMTPKVPPETIHERSTILRELSAEKKESFQERFRGRELTALVLSLQSEGGFVSLTGNYIEAVLPKDEHLVNSLIRVRLEERRSDGRWQAAVLGPHPAEQRVARKRGRVQ